jgi:3-oxoacyl-[acyl-carrier protein] reductase
VLIISVLKRVIITGGTGGLGKSLNQAFCAEGWDTLALSRKDLVLTDSDAVATFFSEHDCDLLICAAGAIDDQPLIKMDEQVWDEIFRINYTAAKICAEAAIPNMLKSGKGHIVFISSYAAIHPTFGQAAYASAKAAILGFTRDLSLRYGSNNIRVNAILPGFMKSNMTAAISQGRKQEVLESHVLGKFNTTDIVAEFILFLEERMPYTSGQIFQLDSRVEI